MCEPWTLVLSYILLIVYATPQVPLRRQRKEKKPFQVQAEDQTAASDSDLGNLE